MQNSKLVELLKTFNAKELRECGELVESPFFNYNKEVIALYTLLRKLAPNFSPKKIEREVIYQSLFPKKRYDDRHMKYLMSFLLKLAEQYIAYTHYIETPILDNIHLLQSYLQRGLNKHYDYTYAQTQDNLQKFPYRNIDFFYLQFLLAETDNLSFQKKNIRKFDARLQSAADYFDIYLLANKLKYFCEMQDWKMTLAADYKLNMSQEIAAYVTARDFSEHPGIMAYWHVLQTQEKPQETDHFFELKKLLRENAATFPPAELRELYNYANNYCIRRVNAGEASFLKELFSLYKETLQAGVLYENDVISPWTYKNLVGVALRLREFNWAKKFIRDYNARLAEEFRDNALHYNLADLYYYQRDFDNAMQHLNKVEFSDIFYSFDTKKMMIKIFFEKGETDPLLSLIASFKIFLKRNQSVSESSRLSYENFISVMNLFLKFFHQRSAPELLDKIENMKLLADRIWLLEQYKKRFK